MTVSPDDGWSVRRTNTPPSPQKGVPDPLSGFIKAGRWNVDDAQGAMIVESKKEYGISCVIGWYGRPCVCPTPRSARYSLSPAAKADERSLHGRRSAARDQFMAARKFLYSGDSRSKRPPTSIRRSTVSSSRLKLVSTWLKNFRSSGSSMFSKVISTT